MGSIVSKSSAGARTARDGFQLGSHVVDLDEQLGHGSFGVVYSGRAIKSGERVAVKKMEILTDDHGTQAVEEIKKYEKLRPHPNLVRLIDYHFKNNAFWLVLEYCTDGNLDEFVCKYSPEKLTLYKFMLQCARGIAHMHGADIPMVHRDVKPANIMLTREGDQLVVKLTDFGLAKDAHLAKSVQLSTKVGTPAFMAPEIYEQKPYDATVDVFALGLVFLGLLLHEHGQELLMPYTEGAPNLIPIGLQMIVASNANGKQPVIISVQASDDKTLQTVKRLIKQMVVKQPDQRLSAHEVVQAIESVVENGNISATAASKKTVRIFTPGDAIRRPVTAKQPKKQVEKLEEDTLYEATDDNASEESEEDESEDLEERLQQMVAGIALRALIAQVMGDDAEEFEVGDLVRIESDESKARQLMKECGGLDEGMEKYLGKVGKITQKLTDEAFVVQFNNGKKWAYNLPMLHKVEGDSDESNVDETTGCSRFKRFDIVVASEDEEKVKKLQKGHGEWVDNIAKCLGVKGIVRDVDSDGDVKVEFINQDSWTLHPGALELVDPTAVSIRKGSLVLVVDDADFVRQQQDDRHGEWNDAMRQVVGHAGKVTDLLTVDCVKVKFGEQAWTMNTAVLKHVATEGEVVAAIIRKMLP